MNRNGLKKIMLLSGTYILLTAVLLVGVSTAKYSDAKLAYASYGAADFNAVILGEHGVLDEENGTVETFGAGLNTEDYRPGMEWSENEEENTSGSLPFTVANGTSRADASEAEVTYKVAVRVTRNLPLRFSVLYGGIRYRSQETPVSVTDEEDGQNWYEWTFYNADDSGALTTEHFFDLTGNTLSVNSHELIVEWPVDETEGTNSADYMREIELIEIRVTASSKNLLSGSETQTITVDPDAYYGTGLFILDPASANAYGEFSYQADYRSFRETETEGTLGYRFEIDNGIGKGFTQTESAINYIVYLKVPYTEETEAITYQLSCEREDGTEIILSPQSEMEYRVYDTLNLSSNAYAAGESSGSGSSAVGESGYGSYVVMMELPEDADEREELIAEYSGEDSRYRLYQVLTFGTEENPMSLSCVKAGTSEPMPDSNSYTLLMSGGTVSERTASRFPLELFVWTVDSTD